MPCDSFGLEFSVQLDGSHLHECGWNERHVTIRDNQIVRKLKTHLSQFRFTVVGVCACSLARLRPFSHCVKFFLSSLSAFWSLSSCKQEGKVLRRIKKPNRFDVSVSFDREKKQPTNTKPESKKYKPFLLLPPSFRHVAPFAALITNESEEWNCLIFIIEIHLHFFSLLAFSPFILFWNVSEKRNVSHLALDRKQKSHSLWIYIEHCPYRYRFYLVISG